MDTFRGKYRTSWGDDGVELPADKERLLRDIFDRAGSRVGCFDVLCWKGDSVISAESKRASKDKFRPTQVWWIEAAISTGLPSGSLLVVEWSLGG